jgi:hypothetical protein
MSITPSTDPIGFPPNSLTVRIDSGIPNVATKALTPLSVPFVFSK